MAIIGFIGLGNMGLPMAHRLKDAGHEVRCFDTSPAALGRAEQAGLRTRSSPAAAVDGADVVITMLPSGQHVLDVLVAADPPFRENALVVDCSTIDVASCAAFHEALGNKGFATLDAPVSGGVAGAAAGTLTFMVGGADAAFARAQDLFSAMGKTIVHAGGAGNGQAAKICNNMILGVSMIAVSEAFVLAEKLGLDAQKLYDISSKSSGQCWSLTSYCPVPGPVPASPANRDYRAGFTAAMMLKDLKLAQEAAGAAGARTPLGADAAKIYEQFVGAGEGPRDFSGVIRFIRGG